MPLASATVPATFSRSNFAGATTGSPRYIDSGVVRGRQGVLLSVDLEEDSPAGDRPGIWSEHSVASLLWDWFDGGFFEGWR